MTKHHGKRQGMTYDINDRGNVVNLRLEVLHRIKPTNYSRTKWGFVLFPEGKIIVKNQRMFDPVEREIRKYLKLPPLTNQPEEEIEDQYEPEPEAVVVERNSNVQTQPASAKLGDFMPRPPLKPDTFFVALSIYEYSVAVFLPSKFLGRKFSAVYDSGTFLLSIDEKDGVPACHNSMERSQILFNRNRFFPEQTFPLFNQLKQEVDFDGENFEISMYEIGALSKKAPDTDLSTLAALTNPAPEVKTPEPEKPKETARERAKRYIQWLNDFSQRNEYEYAIEDGKIVLLRQDRIG